MSYKIIDPYVETLVSKADLEQVTLGQHNNRTFNFLGQPVPVFSQISPFNVSNSSTQGVSFQNQVGTAFVDLSNDYDANLSNFYVRTLNAGTYEIDYQIKFKITIVSGRQHDTRFLNEMDDSNNHIYSFWNKTDTIFDQPLEGGYTSVYDASSSNFTKSKVLLPSILSTGSIESNKVMVDFKIKGIVKYTSNGYIGIHQDNWMEYHGLSSVESFYSKITKIS